MVKEKANIKSNVSEVKEAHNKKEKTTIQHSVSRSNTGSVGGNRSLGKFIVRKKNHLYL